MSRHARHISEQEGPHYWPDGRADLTRWEDCAWCATGMAYDIATGGLVQPTLVQMELVRSRVMGPADGTNAQQLMQAIKAAWGWTPRLIAQNATWATVWASIPLGGAAVLLGRLSMFPAGHRLRRWSPNYLGGHAILLIKESETAGWWDDPLAPQVGYSGEAVTPGEAATFYGGLRGVGCDTIITPAAVTAPAQGVEMYPIITVRPLDAPSPRAMTFKKGAVVIGYDPATPNVRYFETTFTADSSAHVDADVAVDWRNFGAARPIPDSGGTYAFRRVVDGTYAGKLVLTNLKLPDGSPAFVLDPPTPGTAATQAQLDQAAAAASEAARIVTRTKAATLVRGAAAAIDTI